MKNMIKKVTLMLLISAPMVTIASLTPCITDPDGNCVTIGGGGGPGTGTGTQVWVGGWYDSNGVYNTVTASTFNACQTLLNNATSGTFGIVSQCVRVS